MTASTPILYSMEISQIGGFTFRWMSLREIAVEYPQTEQQMQEPQRLQPEKPVTPGPSRNKSKGKIKRWGK